MSKKYHDLLVWQKAHKLVLDIYQITSCFPKDEQFGVTQQLRRAAYSIAANLVEGCERDYTKELIRFATLAKGSLGEVEYFLLLSKDLGYMNIDSYSTFVINCSEIGKMLNGLINSLRHRVQTR